MAPITILARDLETAPGRMAGERHAGPAADPLDRLFTIAFATRDPWTTFLVGLSASVGAGISMGGER
jgi:hypothetical protein